MPDSISRTIEDDSKRGYDGLGCKLLLPAESSTKSILRPCRSCGAALGRGLVTKNGRPKAVVMGADEFESWVETLELLSNQKAVKSLKQGLKESKPEIFTPSKTPSVRSSEVSTSHTASPQRSQGW
jgi:hypothetical protein